MGLAMNQVGTRVYVTNRFTDDVSIIDTATNTVVATVPVGDYPFGITIHPTGKFLYVGNQLGNRAISVIDTDKAEPGNDPLHAVVAVIPLGAEPEGITAHPSGSSVYVALTTNNAVGVIDTCTNTIIGNLIPVGTYPRSFGQFIGPAPLAISLCSPLSCVGFEPPMDNGAVKVKKNRALPLKAQLLDENGNQVTNADIVALPMIHITYNSDIGPEVDVTDQALSAGQGTEDNQFEFHGSKWHFNVKTTNYTAAGTYTITMVSGDASEYTIDPTCTAQFVIE